MCDLSSWSLGGVGVRERRRRDGLLDSTLELRRLFLFFFFLSFLRSFLLFFLLLRFLRRSLSSSLSDDDADDPDPFSPSSDDTERDRFLLSLTNKIHGSA